MGEKAKQVVFDLSYENIDWVKMEDGYNGVNEESSSTTSSSSMEEESSENSFASSSSLDLAEDATSSSSSSSSNGPLFELSDLMAQLPIKRRGLSKYYQGKSESFTSMGRVQSGEDLAKKESGYSYRLKMKLCKSYGGDLADAHKRFHHHHGPKPIISKKVSRGSPSSSSLVEAKRNMLLTS